MFMNFGVPNEVIKERSSHDAVWRLRVIWTLIINLELKIKFKL